MPRFGQRFLARWHLPPSRMRSRTPLLLLLAMLLAVLAISGFTFRLLEGERRGLEALVRMRLDAAGAFLVHRLEQALLNAIQIPFLNLKNIPLSSVERDRVRGLRSSFPEVERVLYMSADLQLADSFPKPQSPEDQETNAWLAQRVEMEGAAPPPKRFAPRTFLETVNSQPALIAFQPIAEADQNLGWLLIEFGIEALRARHVAPLLTQFNHDEQGLVQLLEADAEWDGDGARWPITRFLPGWQLVFHPDPGVSEKRLKEERRLVLGLSAAVVTAIIMATFSVWWEIRRDHALVELRNRFVANVSHELKTPLALIRMYAETLYLDRLRDENRRRDYHRTILREAERLTQMIDSVLDFARLSQGIPVYQLTDRDLRTTVATVAEDYREPMEVRGMELLTDLPETLRPVAHDRRGVTQILVNLLDNAAKYAAEGGQVRVEVRGDEDWVELRVIDCGPGIPSQDRSRVRQAFHRGALASANGGSGLGLALVEQITEAHHAHFILDTPKDGVGVCATVVFPTCKALP
ncbi:MAG: HAMP domain-containing sensor histidine kinase [Pseudomonadota bacterium]